MSASAPVSSGPSAPSSRSGYDGSDDARSFELKLVHLQNLHDRELKALQDAVQRLTDENRSQSKAIEQLTTGMAVLREALTASNARVDALKGTILALFDTPLPRSLR
jgi:hypothetical protein